MPTKRRRMGTDPLTWIVENGEPDLQSGLADPRRDNAEADTADTREAAASVPDVLCVHDEPLSRLLADYFICNRCGTVGHGRDQTNPTPRCTRCDDAATGAGFYFKKPVHAVIDLMQDTYQSTVVTARGGAPDIPQLGRTSSLALVLFFCQLFEIVQEHVLRHIMSASRIPDHAANRLLADNRDPRSRIVKIFATVTGERWRTAIDDLTNKRRIDHVDTVRFLKRCIDLRDVLAVTPDLGAIDDEMGKACMLRIDSLLDLFVALHNRYVPPMLASQRDTPPSTTASV